MQELIIYGGAFNPPHAGHVDVMRQLSEIGGRILLVPSFRHAFGKQMAPFDLRSAWLERIAVRLRSQGYAVFVDTCEQQLGARSDKPVYSWDVLNFIAEREGLDGSQIGFVVGEDNSTSLPSFYRADELISRFSLVTAKERIKLHSTQLRESLLSGKPVYEHWLATGLERQDYAYYQRVGA